MHTRHRTRNRAEPLAPKALATTLLALYASFLALVFILARFSGRHSTAAKYALDGPYAF